MRIAAAVIGGIGALIGAVKGFLLVLFWLLQGPLGDLGLLDPLLGLGTEGAVAISCIFGATGAGLVIGGQSRIGALLMLLGVAGVTAAALAYGLLLPLTQPPDVQAVLGVFPTNVAFYLHWLFPIPPLLIGATLALLAHDGPKSQIDSPERSS